MPPKDLKTGESARQFLNHEYGGLDSKVKNWDFERNLLSMMIRFPESFSDDALAQEYYNGKVNTEVWQFAKAKTMLYEATRFPDDQQSLLDQYQTVLRVTSDSLTWVEIAEGIDSTTVDPILQEMKNRLLTESAALVETITNLQTEIRARQLANLPAVSAFVEDLPEEEIWQQYYKIVLRLQTNRAAGQDWTDQDSTDLRLVAYACREIAGQAVSLARGLLPAPEAFNFVWEGEDPYCNQPRSQKSLPVAGATWSVWPNPAQNQAWVQFATPFTGQVELTSATGKLLLTKSVDQASQLHLAFDALPNGLYLLRCSDPSRPTIKVVIVH